MENALKNGGLMDQVGIVLSTICMIHCAATPVLILLIPAIAASFPKGELVHVSMAILLPVVALSAFVAGYRRHGDRRVWVLGIAGVALIIFGAVDPFGSLTQLAETTITVLGSAMLVSAHIRNRKLCACPH